MKTGLITIYREHPDAAVRVAGSIMLAVVLAVALTVPGNVAARFAGRNLVFLQHWENELEPGALLSLTREFEAAHGGVTITLDTRTGAELYETLARSGGETPLRADIIGIRTRWLSEPAIRELMEFPVPDGKNDETPAGSLVSSMIVLFYNIDLLEAAGIDRPPKTREDLEKLAATLAEKNRAVLSLALAAEAYIEIYPWLWAAGGRIFPEDRAEPFSGPDFNKSNSIAALAWLALLNEKGYLAPEPFTKTAAEKRDDFRAGRAAMMLAPVSLARELREAGVRFDITTVPVPASYRGRPVFGLEGWIGGVARTSRRKADARAFLGFLAENAPRLAAAWGAVPGDPAQGTYTGSDPILAKAYSIYEAGVSPENFAAQEYSARLDAIVREELRALFAGTQSAEDTARAITERGNAGRE